MIWYRQSKTKDGASGSCTRVQLPVCVSLHFLLPMPCSEFLKLGGHLLTTVCAQCQDIFVITIAWAQHTSSLIIFVPSVMFWLPTFPSI